MPAVALAFVLVLCSTTIARAQDAPRLPPRAAVVSAHPLATQAGEAVLAQGGNAFDAAVAVSAMLSVVEPFSSGIGGGGFWLIHDAAAGADTMLDARETAPLAATRDMYLDENGAPVPGASTDGPGAAGIPGIPAAFDAIARDWGSLPLSALLAPAIKTAREGFPVDARYVNGARHKADLLRRYSESAAIFLDNGAVPAEGWILKQPDLAETLSMIAQKGAAGFYTGTVADKLVADSRAHGGIWTRADLAAYKTARRQPITFAYNGVEITSAAPPSSGGIVLANALNILSGFDLDALDATARKHLVIEAMRRAYRDRARYLGDADFVDIPVDRLTSADYAAEQRASIRMDAATNSADLAGGDLKKALPKGADTTHFAVLDRHGNRVAVTQSINFWFGSGFVAKGTGVILNNEMDDFAIAPGVENGYGLIGADANAIAPGKRMLSSMSPTFAVSPRGVAVIGTPGGSRIISMVLLAILDWIDVKDAKAIVSAPRYHHQFHPDKVVYEPGALSDAEAAALAALGHDLAPQDTRYGNMQVILWDYDSGAVSTGSDPRGEGSGRVY